MPNNANTSRVLLMLFTSVWSVHAQTVRANTDVESFRALAPHDKIEFALAVMDARDASLQNVSYKVVETEVNTRKSDRVRRFALKRDYEMRRKGQTCWMHARNYTGFKEDGGVTEDVFINWDGTTARRVAEPPYCGKRPQCAVDASESSYFARRRLSELLGFRIEITNQSFPMTRWLRDMAAKGKVEASLLDETGEIYVVVIPNKVSQYGFRMDPRRGFMITTFERIYFDGFSRGVTRVLEAAQFDGVWFPTKAIRQADQKPDKEESEATCVVSDVSIGSVTDGDVALEFPVGATVIDRVKKISYDILPNGQFRLQPLANSEAHVVYVPAQKTVTDRIDSQTPQQYKTQPLVYAQAAPSRVTPASRWVRWGILIVSLVALVVVGLGLWRQRHAGRTTGVHSGD